jgi:hypothetical protein
VQFETRLAAGDSVRDLGQLFNEFRVAALVVRDAEVCDDASLVDRVPRVAPVDLVTEPIDPLVGGARHVGYSSGSPSNMRLCSASSATRCRHAISEARLRRYGSTN